MCIIYLILQGVGDGTQPISSKYYGETKFDKLISIRKLAYGFGTLLSVIGCIMMYITRADIGVLFGTSNEVNMEIAKIIPVFLISVPFVSVNRITTESFYATEKIMLSYI